MGRDQGRRTRQNGIPATAASSSKTEPCTAINLPVQGHAKRGSWTHQSPISRRQILFQFLFSLKFCKIRCFGIFSDPRKSFFHSLSHPATAVPTNYICICAIYPSTTEQDENNKHCGHNRGSGRGGGQRTGRGSEQLFPKVILDFIA